MLCMLLAFAQEEDREAVARIYLRLERKMYAVARSILHDHHAAEEAVYESFVKIIQHFPKINLLPCTEMDRYIVIVVKNTALNMLRKEARRAEWPEEWQIPAAPEDTESGAGYRYLVDLIRAMPEHYRQVLELALVLEWSTKEIARVLKVNENTVSSRLKRGRELLQKQLREGGAVDDGARI